MRNASLPPQHQKVFDGTGATRGWMSGEGVGQRAVEEPGLNLAVSEERASLDWGSDGRRMSRLLCGCRWRGVG